MGRQKGSFKHTQLKIHNGVDHQPLKKAPSAPIKEIAKQTSRQIADSYISDDAYDVDFYSNVLGRISIKELRRTSPEYIKRFFEEFERAKVVVITVTDIDRPKLNEKTSLILEHGNPKMKLHARFFRALLSEEKKDPYVRKYNNHYKRLEQLVLDAGKEIDLEGY